MADFVSDFWHWFVVIGVLVSVLAMFPLIYLNREKKSGEAKTMGHVWDDDLEEYDNPLPAWWFNMFLITIVFGLVYLLLFPGLGHFPGLLKWTSKGLYEKEMLAAQEIYDPIYTQYAQIEIPALSKDPAAKKTGERLFANYCAGCHGSDARGAKGFPNLRDQDWQFGGEPAQIKTSIMSGRMGIMPGWEAVLQEEGVDNVAHYIVSLSDREHDADKAKLGAEKYAMLCVGCHQVDATGNPMLGAPNLADRTWLYGGSLNTIKASVRTGRNGQMPAHGEFLGEDRVHVLAAYVYGLSQEYEHD